MITSREWIAKGYTIVTRVSSVRCFPIAVAVLLVAGCEGSLSLRLFDAGAPDGDATDAAAADASPDRTCPPISPSEGEACDTPGLWCEFGGGAHQRCATRALCTKKAGTGGKIEWATFGADFPCAPNVAACPPSFGAASDASCPVTTGSCDYSAGRCTCGECGDTDGGRLFQWRCRAWDDVAPFLDDGGLATAPAGCPADRPRLGTACASEGFVCGYDACYGVSLGPYLTCTEGEWSVGPQTDLCNRPACR